MSFRVLVSKVHGPDSRPCAKVENPLDLRLGFIRRREAETVVKSKEKEVMLEI
jgi:hypothetical protein